MVPTIWAGQIRNLQMRCAFERTEWHHRASWSKKLCKCCLGGAGTSRLFHHENKENWVWFICGRPDPKPVELLGSGGTLRKLGLVRGKYVIEKHIPEGAIRTQTFFLCFPAAMRWAASPSTCSATILSAVPSQNARLSDHALKSQKLPFRHINWFSLMFYHSDRKLISTEKGMREDHGNWSELPVEGLLLGLGKGLSEVEGKVDKWWEVEDAPDLLSSILGPCLYLSLPLCCWKSPFTFLASDFSCVWVRSFLRALPAHDVPFLPSPASSPKTQR